MSDWPDQPRALRVMFEATSRVIWNVPDEGSDLYGTWGYEELGVPEGLRQRFLSWASRCQSANERDFIDEEESGRLDTEGRTLARELKRVVGADVTVYYEQDEIDGETG